MNNKKEIKNKMIAVAPDTFIKLLDIQRAETTQDFRPTIRQIIDGLINFYFGKK